MFKHFINLEWKAFFRSANLGKTIAMKILMGFLVLYFSVVFLSLGIGAFYIIKEMNLDPLVTVNKFLIYYFVIDLVIRLIMQAIPVMNIRPLLILPIKKPTIVHFSLGKTVLSFFNLIHVFFFVPFTIVLLIEGYNPTSVLLWHLAMISLVIINNFLNILLNNKDNLYAVLIGISLVLEG